MKITGTLMVETDDGHSLPSVSLTGKCSPAKHHPVLMDPVIESLLEAMGISPLAMEKLLEQMDTAQTTLAIRFDPGEGPDHLELPATHSTLNPADAEENAWWNEVADCNATEALVHLDRGIFLVARHHEGSMHYTLTTPGLPASVANEEVMPLEKIIEIKALSGMNLTATKQMFQDYDNERTNFDIAFAA